MKSLKFNLFFILTFLICSSASAFEKQEAVPVKIKADRLEYLEEQNLIIGEGNVDLVQGDTNLKADYMKFHVDTDEIYAKGNVLLIQKDNTLKGEELTYNINKSQGIMEKSVSKQEKWVYSNEEVEQVGENKFYASKQSLFTTCEEEAPHYKFRAKEMILYPKERLVCRDVNFMIKDVPTLYYPFYTRKLNEKNRWHLGAGYNKRKGIILRAKYDYFNSNNSYGNYVIDWWQFVGWGTGFDHNYSLFSGKGKGKAYLYYRNVKIEDTTGSYTDTEREEWKFDVNHEQMLYEKTAYETVYNTAMEKETVKEGKHLTVNSKLNLHYQNNVEFTNSTGNIITVNPSDETRDIKSTFDITTTRDPITFRVAAFQKRVWDYDMKEFKKTEEKLPDISFTLSPTQIGRTKPPVNYSLNATYVVSFDRGDREEAFDVVRNDLNPGAGNTDTYIVKVLTFPSSGTVRGTVVDNTGTDSSAVTVVLVDYEKKEVTVKNPKGPFKVDPRDRIIIKYATKFSTQSATMYQKLQTNFSLLKGRILNISYSPAVGYSEDWRDKKTMEDPGDRRVSGFDLQNTISTKITDFITWQNTHYYKRQWQDIAQDPYKGIVANSLTTSLVLNSPFDSATILYRTSINFNITYDIRRKNKFYYDTATQKQVVMDEKIPIENKKSQFGDLTVSLTSRPKDYFDVQSNIAYDIYCDSSDVGYPVSDTTYPGNVQALKKGKLKSIESTLHFVPVKYLDLSYRHNLYYLFPKNSNATIDSLVKIPLTRYWEGSCLSSFRNDSVYVFHMKDFKLDKYKIALTRDLHCWVAEFSIRKQMAKIGVTEDIEFWFTLELKAFPSKKFGVLGKERYMELRDQI